VTPNYDSSIEPGKKGMLTEPIEDMTTEKFKDAFWKWVPNQEPLTQYETKRECTGTRDTCMVVRVEVEVSGVASLLVSFSGTLYFKYFEKDGDIIIEHYGGDDTLKTLGHRTVWRLLEDPFRIEVYDEETGSRRAGPFIKGMFEGDLKALGVEFEKVEPDMDSPSQPGQKSCIASGIKGDITSQTLMEKSEFWMRENGGEQKADGAWLLESAGWVSSTTYSTCRFDKENDTIIRQDHGEDSTATEVIFEVHTRVLKDPVRIERWVFPKGGTNSDEGACKAVGKTIDVILAADK